MKKVEKIIYFLILRRVRSIKYVLNTNVESGYILPPPNTLKSAQDMHVSGARYCKLLKNLLNV